MVKIAPAGLDHVFFTNSGSESVDTALKIALAYHRVKGDAARMQLVRPRARLSRRGLRRHQRRRHGRRIARRGPRRMIPGVDHLAHTHDLKRNAFTRGVPAHGAELADELERLVALHDASTIAAVIVEPIAGSTGVVLPPQGYLKRLREICDKHGILLIFDEVITGFGRTGSAFAAQEFGVTPDIITCAKGLTNGCVPDGRGARLEEDLRRVHAGPAGRHRAVPRLHLFRASRSPAPRASRALGIYEGEGLLTRARQTGPLFENALHALRGLPHVIDIRNYGLVAGIELEPIAGSPGARAFDVLPQVLRARAADPHDGRHHRAVARAHHRAQAHRRVVRRPVAGPARRA